MTTCHKVAVYTSQKCRVCCPFFCTCQTFLIAFSPLNLPLLKTDQGCTCLTWLELLTFSPTFRRLKLSSPFRMKPLKLKVQMVKAYWVTSIQSVFLKSLNTSLFIHYFIVHIFLPRFGDKVCGFMFGTCRTCNASRMRGCLLWQGGM